jgi:hypothetical protein
MPFFLIAPVWLLFVVIGVSLCFFRQTRFLSWYFVLVSSTGMFVSFVLSTLLLWVIPRLFGSMSSWARWIFIALYLASIAFGGLIGAAAGFFAARKMNQRLRWTLPS